MASSYKGPNGITTGWYLPNKEELNLLYQAKENGTLVGFATDLYWSSSEVNIFYAWIQYFDNGNNGYQTVFVKVYPHGVRAVRAF